MTKRRFVHGSASTAKRVQLSKGLADAAEHNSQCPLLKLPQHVLGLVLHPSRIPSSSLAAVGLVCKALHEHRQQLLSVHPLPNLTVHLPRLRDQNVLLRLSIWLARTSGLIITASRDHQEQQQLSPQEVSMQIGQLLESSACNTRHLHVEPHIPMLLPLVQFSMLSNLSQLHVPVHESWGVERNVLSTLSGLVNLSHLTLEPPPAQAHADYLTNLAGLSHLTHLGLIGTVPDGYDDGEASNDAWRVASLDDLARLTGLKSLQLENMLLCATGTTWTASDDLPGYQLCYDKRTSVLTEGFPSTLQHLRVHDIWVYIKTSASSWQYLAGESLHGRGLRSLSFTADLYGPDGWVYALEESQVTSFMRMLPRLQLVHLQDSFPWSQLQTAMPQAQVHTPPTGSQQPANSTTAATMLQPGDGNNAGAVLPSAGPADICTSCKPSMGSSVRVLRLPSQSKDSLTKSFFSRAMPLLRHLHLGIEGTFQQRSGSTVPGPAHSLDLQQPYMLSLLAQLPPTLQTLSLAQGTRQDLVLEGTWQACFSSYLPTQHVQDEYNPLHADQLDPLALDAWLTAVQYVLPHLRRLVLLAPRQILTTSTSHPPLSPQGKAGTSTVVAVPAQLPASSTPIPTPTPTPTPSGIAHPSSSPMGAGKDGADAGSFGPLVTQVYPQAAATSPSIPAGVDPSVNAAAFAAGATQAAGIQAQKQAQEVSCCQLRSLYLLMGSVSPAAWHHLPHMPALQQLRRLVLIHVGGLQWSTAAAAAKAVAPLAELQLLQDVQLGLFKAASAMCGVLDKLARDCGPAFTHLLLRLHPDNAFGPKSRESVLKAREQVLMYRPTLIVAVAAKEGGCNVWPPDERDADGDLDWQPWQFESYGHVI